MLAHFLHFLAWDVRSNQGERLIVVIAVPMRRILGRRRDVPRMKMFFGAVFFMKSHVWIIGCISAYFTPGILEKPPNIFPLDYLHFKNLN
jgi:hypothetical protein